MPDGVEILWDFWTQDLACPSYCGNIESLLHSRHAAKVTWDTLQGSVVGDGHPPPIRGLCTHYKDSLLEVG